jgi:hypothetical protein
MSKIFGIGLSRTGSHSLVRALHMLKFKTIHWPKSFHAIESVDAAADITVTAHFKTLDKKYPGSKFVFLERELGVWLNSCANHYRWLAQSRLYENLDPNSRTFVVQADEAVYHRPYRLHLNCHDSNYTAGEFSAAYFRLKESVDEYFSNRAHDLLRMNLSAGSGWNELVPFVGKSFNDIPFPHEGKRGK